MCISITCVNNPTGFINNFVWYNWVLYIYKFKINVNGFVYMTINVQLHEILQQNKFIRRRSFYIIFFYINFSFLKVINNSWQRLSESALHSAFIHDSVKAQRNLVINIINHLGWRILPMKKIQWKIILEVCKQNHYLLYF